MAGATMQRYQSLAQLGGRETRRDDCSFARESQARISFA